MLSKPSIESLVLRPLPRTSFFRPSRSRSITDFHLLRSFLIWLCELHSRLGVRSLPLQSSTAPNLLSSVDVDSIYPPASTRVLRLTQPGCRQLNQSQESSSKRVA